MGGVPEEGALIEKRFIFFPEPQILETPANWGLSFEDVHFRASDGVSLHGWFVPSDGEVTWIWFHGNAGNISYLLENLMLLHNGLGVNIFLFDYRGLRPQRRDSLGEGHLSRCRRGAGLSPHSPGHKSS